MEARQSFQCVGERIVVEVWKLGKKLLLESGVPRRLREKGLLHGRSPVVSSDTACAALKLRASAKSLVELEDANSVRHLQLAQVKSHGIARTIMIASWLHANLPGLASSFSHRSTRAVGAGDVLTNTPGS